MEFIEIENLHTSGVYAKHPIAIARGNGAILWDENGKEFIDCNGGHGVANAGHANPLVAQAIALQAETLISLPETFYNRKRSELMDRLCRITAPLDRVFFCNSGTEAIEGAIKFARLSTGRTGIIAAMRGFHGRTFGSLSATWNRKYRQSFEPLVPDFDHVPFNNIDALESAITAKTAAVILEVIQGEGGVHPADPEFILAAQDLCNQNGTLLIIDEVQTGYGRTGKFFAYQHYGLKPDILCVAKAMAGGLPMGAIFIGESVNNLEPGYHGSTFGGNPLVCSAALAILDFFEKEDLVRQSFEKGRYFIGKLNQINSSLIREIRGIGLMIGIELKQKVSPSIQSLEENGVLVLPAGLTVIRLLPPLVITYPQIDKVVQTLQLVLGDDNA